MARRLTILALSLVFVGLWLVPNVAGQAFVQVHATSAQRAGTLEIRIDVVNTYPLPVVLGFDGPAFRAVVYREEQPGQMIAISEVTGEDPRLESGSDSPGGGESSSGSPDGEDRVAYVESGEMGSQRTLLRWPSMPPMAQSDRHLVRAWAYGVASPLLPVARTD